MTTKINGAAYPGVWVEKKTAFAKITFSKDIKALVQGDLYLLGTTTPPSATTVADSTFGVVESAIVAALKLMETKATVLAVSAYDASAYSIDVLLGNAEGWFSNNVGLIVTGQAVPAAQAVVTTGGVTPTTTLGSLVTVRPAAVTFKMEFASFDGKMTVATLANAGLVAVADGATPGTAADPMGQAGYYPA